MILNWTKRDMALFLAGSTTTPPTYFTIGSGSGTAIATQTELLNPFDRQLITLANGSTINKITYVSDWNSVEMSGTQLREWGMNVSGTALTGSMWSRTSMPNTITFDGTTELRIEETWEVY